MSEQLKSMKDAVKGKGGGLQSTSQAVGETIAENTNMRSGSKENAEEGGTSLGDIGKSGGAPSAQGPTLGGDQQAINQESGTADHLGVGKPA